MLGQVSIPDKTVWDYPSKQKIIRIQDDIGSETDFVDRLSSLLNKAQRRNRTAIFLELSSLSILKFFQRNRKFRPKLKILISDDQLGEIHRHRAQLISIKPIIVLNQCKSSLPRTIQFLASLNLPIEIKSSVLMDQDEKSFLDLSERLLFSPFVKTPVQPFLDLLLSLVGTGHRNSFTLWETYNESIGQDFFITNDGEITLSERWANVNRFFGDISNSIKDIHLSNLYREIVLFRKEVGYRKNAKCDTCDAFRFCAGYLRAFDASYNCASFISLYSFMSSHVPSLKKYFAALPKQKKKDLFQIISGAVET